jgi:hypothetical protein
VTISQHVRFDWTRFVVHFVCGGLAAALLGFGMWAKSADAPSASGMSGFIYIGGAALVCGMIAGCIGDDFWRKLGGWFRWW